MEPEVQGQVEEQGEVLEATDVAVEEAAFSAVVDGADAETAPAQDEKTEVQETQPEAAAETTEEAQTEEETPQEKLNAILADIPNRDELTQKEIRQIHGKIGELNGLIKKLEASGSNPAKVRLTADKLTKLNESFPEIAEMLADDLSSALEVGNTEAPDVSGQVEQVRTELTQQFEQKMQLNLLTVMHRDWKEVNDSDEFKGWVKTLPEAEQKTLADSWDAIYLGDKFTEFKTWRASQQNTKARNDSRLKGAVIPKGSTVVSKAAQTEEDGFASAFS